MKRKGATKPPARSFQFVSLTPELAGDDVAKAHQRRLVRSNAATFQWSRQRKVGEKSTSVEDEGDTASNAGNITQDTISSGNSAGQPPNTASNEAMGRKGKSKSEPEPESLSPDKVGDQTSAALAIIAQSTDHVTYLPSPQQYTVVSPIDQAGQQLRYNVHYIIPRLVPEIQKGIENPAADLWVRLALENASLYHTWVHCVSVYYFALRGQWKRSEFLLSTHSRALEALNKEMQHPINACSDSNILAVWGLAVHGWERFLPPGHKVPNQGRMKQLQSLDRYSLMKFVPLHLDGLGVLIQMRGGLDQVTSEGIAALISYTGIVQATKTLDPPRWPYISLCRTFTPLDGMSTPIGPYHPLAKLGSGFHHAFNSTAMPLLKDLHDVIQDISSFTILLHDCDLGKDFSESVGQVADQRNLIQYKLMSLPKNTHLQLEVPQAQTYEIMRLATIIFSLLIIFPITPSAAPYVQVASQLRAVLQNIDIYAQSSHELNLVTWAVFMGGIASIGTSDRPWYVSILDSIFSHQDSKSWEEVKVILGKFLWLESTNDVDGVSLWLELVQLQSYKRQFEISQHSRPPVR